MRFSFHFGQICLYMGYSVEEQQRICRLLDQKGIYYHLYHGMFELS